MGGQEGSATEGGGRVDVQLGVVSPLRVAPAQLRELDLQTGDFGLQALLLVFVRICTGTASVPILVLVKKRFSQCSNIILYDCTTKEEYAPYCVRIGFKIVISIRVVDA